MVAYKSYLDSDVTPVAYVGTLLLFVRILNGLDRLTLSSKPRNIGGLLISYWICRLNKLLLVLSCGVTLCMLLIW
ncbi:hypothetical protein BDB00DRAFT_837342 [Zychaea mexicana]|uniref:uncharacterized protein n=1 Tax=Zychaea mexicana TaxID=64656 RepID=UPI0022FE5172|nr:uncharacterized protein BDB00DRAFT_837342 [Zychaea mexicana]KAI9490478.1 hypothetical protein BDB00DRAFT_837342 [Zychaea mexicana]